MNYIFSHPVQNKNKNKGSQRFLKSSDCLYVVDCGFDIELLNGEFTHPLKKTSPIIISSKNQTQTYDDE